MHRGPRRREFAFSEISYLRLKGASEMKSAMKYCENCDKEFDTEETKCPVCGHPLVETEEDHTAEIVATMTTLNIL